MVYTIDGAHKVKDAEPTKTRVAQFEKGHIAEHSADGGLSVFRICGDAGDDDSEVADSAKGPMTARKLQRLNEASRRAHAK